MRILSIIPVCEGSQVLPNKNLRVISGKPMIYYAINNAKKSSYITDILVTTNSEEIITIARQLGVKVKRRDDYLSSIEISLEEVVYDVKSTFDFSEYDYVVTMQPISPLLKHTTLDSAIEYCISGDYDTVISVTNRAQYYWNMKGCGIPEPMIQQRMNKHQLPPFYAETGAFLITRSSCICKDTRIGEKCGLYEISGDEALDVFTFGDLKQADSILSRKTIAFYVNGNNNRGLGHIYRVLQLADEFFAKPDIYFDKNKTKREFFGCTMHNIIAVDGTAGLISAIKEKQYDVLINDILSTSAEYMKTLKTNFPEMRIVNFEDEGNGAEYADIVFNALYDESYAKNVKVGSYYYIAPKLFLMCDPIQIKEKVEKVLVTFGGADPMNYTDVVLEVAQKQKYNDIHFIFVLGKAKKGYEKLLSIHRDNFELLHNIDNMPEVMSKCDMAFSSRGRTGYELAILGIPTISIAQNEREERHNFMSEKNGYCYIGYNPEKELIEEALDKLVFSPQDERKLYQKKMLANNLRCGRKNIMNIIDNL